MSAPAIIARGLGKAFEQGWLRPPHVALHPLDLDVLEDRGLLLLGANGSGKSTLLSLIAGLRRPSTGTVSVYGTDPRQAAGRKHLGWLPERARLPEHLSARQLLDALEGMHEAPDAARRARLEERLDLGPYRDRPLRTLSSGQAQRVGLASALLHRPRVLLLDEPLVTLDTPSLGHVRDVLHDAREDGITLVVATHRPEAFLGLCEGAMWLEGGRLGSLASLALLEARLPAEVVYMPAPRPSDTPVDLTDPVVRFGVRRTVVQPAELTATLDHIQRAGGQILRVSRVPRDVQVPR